MTVSIAHVKKLLKRLHGWMCFRIYMATPAGVTGLCFRSCCPLWVHVVAWAGFYVSLGRNQ